MPHIQEMSFPHPKDPNWNAAQACVVLSLFTDDSLPEARKGFLNFIDVFSEIFLKDLLRHQTGVHSSSVPKIRNTQQYLARVNSFFLDPKYEEEKEPAFFSMAFSGNEVWDARVPAWDIHFFHRNPESKWASQREVSRASMFLPIEYFLADPKALLAFFIKAAGTFPFLYGTAGYSLYIPHYHDVFANKADPELKKSLQSYFEKHVGVVQHHPSGSELLIGKSLFQKNTLQHSMTRINWLTFLGEPYVSELGGIEKLKKEASGKHFIVHDLSLTNIPRVLLQAGEAPDEHGNIAYEEIRTLLKKYVSDYSFYFSKIPFYQYNQDEPL